MSSEPLEENLDAIIMEFKVQNTAKEKSLEQTATLRQIEEKQYDIDLLSRGITKERIRHYGFAFRGKKVLIGNQGKFGNTSEKITEASYLCDKDSRKGAF